MLNLLKDFHELKELIKPIQEVKPNKKVDITKEGWEKAIRQCLTK